MLVYLAYLVSKVNRATQVPAVQLDFQAKLDTPVFQALPAFQAATVAPVYLVRKVKWVIGSKASMASEVNLVYLAFPVSPVRPVFEVCPVYLVQVADVVLQVLLAIQAYPA